MFIKHAATFVNLDAVGKASPAGHLAGRGTPAGYFTATRSLIEPAGVPDLKHLTAPVLRSGPVTTMICISPTGAVTAAVIAGYRVCRTGLEPLFLVEPPEGVTKFLAVGAHGFVRLDDGEVFPDPASAWNSVAGETPKPEVVETVEHKSEVVAMPKVAGRRR